ncbi:hypothetical protein MTO96_040751 [Rhipicephalus appendiculatus]
MPTARDHRAGGHRFGSLPGLPAQRAADGDAHNILAYADDLTPLADSPAQLQDRINIVETLASPLGLALNPAKCSSLHMCGATPVGMRPTTFTVSGVPIQPQRFLGRPVGFRLPSRTSSAIDDAIAHANAIFTSMLAPWQRIDAVKTFIDPALNFAMRCGVFTKTDWRRLDKVVRPLVKRTLYLPGNASTHYIYGSAASGAVAIPVAAELSDICRIDSAFKLLTTHCATWPSPMRTRWPRLGGDPVGARGLPVRGHQGSLPHPRDAVAVGVDRGAQGFPPPARGLDHLRTAPP